VVDIIWDKEENSENIDVFFVPYNGFSVRISIRRYSSKNPIPEIYILPIKTKVMR
jgi:hypothetical protein